MARYDVTRQIDELAELGVTFAEAEATLGSHLNIDGPTIYAWGRRGESAVTNLLHEARERASARERRAALTSGSVAEWRKLGGAWLIAGAGLIRGEVVTVQRRDGSSSLEVVGQIVATHDGLVYARAGAL